MEADPRERTNLAGGAASSVERALAARLAGLAEAEAAP